MPKRSTKRFLSRKIRKNEREQGEGKDRLKKLRAERLTRTAPAGRRKKEGPTVRERTKNSYGRTFIGEAG